MEESRHAFPRMLVNSIELQNVFLACFPCGAFNVLVAFLGLFFLYLYHSFSGIVNLGAEIFVASLCFCVTYIRQSQNAGVCVTSIALSSRVMSSLKRLIHE